MKLGYCCPRQHHYGRGYNHHLESDMNIKRWLYSRPEGYFLFWRERVFTVNFDITAPLCLILAGNLTLGFFWGLFLTACRITRGPVVRRKWRAPVSQVATYESTMNQCALLITRLGLLFMVVVPWMLISRSIVAVINRETAKVSNILDNTHAKKKTEQVQL